MAEVIELGKPKVHSNGYFPSKPIATIHEFYLTGEIGSPDEYIEWFDAIRHASDRGDLKYNQVDIDNMKKSLKENNFFACSNLGYDRYFYMTSSPKNIEEDKIEIDASMTKSKMANAFKKTQISKRSARVLVSKFAEEIAVAI